MIVTDRRKQARDSFEPRIWGDAFAELSAAHREGPLDVEDLERLAVAAYMVGRDDECEDAWMGAHQEWLGPHRHRNEMTLIERLTIAIAPPNSQSPAGVQPASRVR